MSTALSEFTHDESKRCGYMVTEGFRYCRTCGGGGLLDNAECFSCRGAGEHRLDDEHLALIEELAVQS